MSAELHTNAAWTMWAVLFRRTAKYLSQLQQHRSYPLAQIESTFPTIALFSQYRISDLTQIKEIPFPAPALETATITLSISQPLICRPQISKEKFLMRLMKIW
jgi:hypothetical protein